jgi:hypothetical protein
MNPVGWIIGVFLILVIMGLIIWMVLRYDYKPPPLQPCNTDQPLLELPLWQSGGVFLTQIHLGDATHTIAFNVVPDTGSRELIVAGPNCKGCDPTDGVWDFSIGQNVSGGLSHSILYAGGQTSQYVLWQAYLKDYSDNKQVDFGVITSSSSSEGDPLNVMGLQEGGFLEDLCGAKEVLFNFSQGRLDIGNISPMIPATASTFSLQEPSSGILFVMGRVTGLAIDGQPVAANLVPQLAIFDTGSTDTYVSPDLLKLLNTGNHTVTITFDNNGSPTPVTFRSTPNNVATESFPFANSMVLGNRWLSQYNLAIKYDQKQISMFH